MRLLAALLIMISMSFASIDYSLDMVSSYVFRGVDFGDPVQYVNPNSYSYPKGYNNSPAIQPGLTYNFGNGLTIGAWASLGLGSKSTQELDELDVTAKYSFKIKDVDSFIGYTHYTFPSLAKYLEREDIFNKADSVTYTDSDEVFAGVILGNLPLAPALTVYNDYDQNLVKDDRTQYTFTTLGLTLPQVYGLNSSLTFCFDSTKWSNKLTHYVLGVNKSLGNNFTGYMNVIALTGSQAAVGLYGDPDETDEDTGKVSTRKAINDDKYELVFGVNYTGSFLN